MRMNYYDIDNDEDRLIYEESPPGFPDGMGIYEPKDMGGNLIPAEESSDGSGSSKKRLKREMLATALKRLEDSARTEADFRNIIGWWDRLDSNRERKERYHEVGRDESRVPLEWGMSRDYTVFPVPADQAFWKEMMRGNFLDMIFDCPLEIHENIEDMELSKILNGLKDEQKEVLYYISIRLYPTSLVGSLFGQTDRNIRKKRAVILKKVWKEYSRVLGNRIQNHGSMTLRERKYMEKNYPELCRPAENERTDKK